MCQRDSLSDIPEIHTPTVLLSTSEDASLSEKYHAISPSEILTFNDAIS